MKKPRIVDAMEHIDENLITDAVSYRPKRSRISTATKWIAAAACFAVVMITGLSLLHGNRIEPTSIGGVIREYTDTSVQAEESSLIWPWEYQTIDEKFPALLYHGKQYSVKTYGMTMDQSLLGEKLGSGEGVGYDPYTEKKYRQDFDVWQLKGISSELMIAAEMDGQFYPLQCNAYEPPAVLGELLDNFSLSQTLVLERFHVSADGKEKETYTLPDDDHIWQILNSCRDAPFVEDQEIGGDCIDFTVTSPTLGVYKRAFYVTADGYVSTNLFDWTYTFYVGEDRAAEIISYAKKNAMKAEWEPYIHSLAGTLTEIGDGYILVDDSILCADVKDGMVFKVLSTDLRISRCIDYQKIEVGSIVVVGFTEPVHTEVGNLVDSAVSLNQGYLIDGSISIEE